MGAGGGGGGGGWGGGGHKKTDFELNKDNCSNVSAWSDFCFVFVS